jgi:hypothetical protein
VSHDDFEPMNGLPGVVPAGEQILWQGVPRWQTLARHAFHVDKAFVYFGALLVLDGVRELSSGSSVVVALQALYIPTVLALAALATLTLLAYLSARSTVYTVTSRRVAIRTGIAFSVTINLPFRLIDGVSLRTARDGTGDLPLRLARGERIGYFLAWPSVRPWHYTAPQPMLRAVESPVAVGEILASAVADVPAVAARQVPTSSVVTGHRHGDAVTA